MWDELAELLSVLRRDGRQQSGLDPRLVPADKAAAYRTAATVEKRLGWSIGGWKIAAMKAEMQAALRTDSPIYGRVYAQFLHQSPFTFETVRLLHPVAEAEYMARLSVDLPPRNAPYGQDEVSAAVGSLHPGLEIAECRFSQDAAFPPLSAVLADGSGSGSLVMGPAIEDWRTANIPGQRVSLCVNGKERRHGSAGAALDHPLVPLTWLANELSRTGIGLKAGQVVSTGTCSGMILARAGETHVADFGPFGQVEARF